MLVLCLRRRASLIKHMVACACVSTLDKELLHMHQAPGPPYLNRAAFAEDTVIITIRCFVERFTSPVRSDSLLSCNDGAVKAAVSSVCYIQMRKTAALPLIVFSRMCQWETGWEEASFVSPSRDLQRINEATQRSDATALCGFRRKPRWTKGITVNWPTRNLFLQGGRRRPIGTLLWDQDKLSNLIRCCSALAPAERFRYIANLFCKTVLNISHIGSVSKKTNSTFEGPSVWIQSF